jgi:hypothetical protein
MPQEKKIINVGIAAGEARRQRRQVCSRLGNQQSELIFKSPGHRSAVRRYSRSFPSAYVKVPIFFKSASY